MDGPGKNLTDDELDRLWRISTAFIESGIGSTAALDALLARLYRREPESFAHLHRVAALTTRIGAQIGLAARTLEHIERSALIHDVGRLVVRDHMDVSNLQADTAMMQHRAEQVAVTFELVKDLAFLRPAGEIVASSLECFDGSGSPGRLSGSAIPLGSRILHVADTLDALTSVCLSMPYPAEVVNAELVRMAGARFDPDIVAAWLRCADDIPPAVMSWWSSTVRMN